MKKSKISVSLLVLFSCSLAFAEAKQGNPPTEKQVAKLAAAAWKERPDSIDITLYLELTKPPKPIEQIRKEVEEMIDQGDREYYKKKGWTKDSLPDYAARRRKKNIEANVNLRIKRQQFPRLMKKRIRKVVHKQCVDQVIAEPGEELEPNMPFDGTYVNSGERNSEDFYSFHYEHKIKRAIIEDESGWVRREPARFVGLPSGTASLLQVLLGVTNQGGQDPNKMQELSKKGLARIDHPAGVLRVRVMVNPEPNAPGNRDRIEIKDPNYPCGTILICDRDDYSRVYYAELCSRRTEEPFYIRKCSNFNSQGFPRNVTEIKYDIDGNFEEKSVYRIIKVELNPSIPDEVFEFRPPPDYKVIDSRSKKP